LRVLAVDPGSKRVGVAVSDPSGTIAQALTTIDAEPQDTLPERLAEIARREEAGSIVVGLPRRMDGSEGPEAKSARVLAEALRKVARVQVTLVDERLTTVQAERAMIESGARRARRKARVDQVAAALLLQSHLDRQR
jgi:putative pre-16S rRNA nuclease